MRVALLLLWCAALTEALDRGTVLVTGASRGIGAACARRLAKDGYVVAVNYCSNADGAARVVKEIVEGGGSAEAFQADVSTEKAVVDLFNAIDASPLPPLTGLVNNAGIIGFDMPQTLETATTEVLTALMATNVLGPMICCREAAKRMASGSAIVNLSSGSAYLGRPLLYSMSKGALNSMTIGLIEPLAANGITRRPAFYFTAPVTKTRIPKTEGLRCENRGSPLLNHFKDVSEALSGRGCCCVSTAARSPFSRRYSSQHGKSGLYRYGHGVHHHGGRRTTHQVGSRHPHGPIRQARRDRRHRVISYVPRRIVHARREHPRRRRQGPRHDARIRNFT